MNRSERLHIPNRTGPERNVPRFIQIGSERDGTANGHLHKLIQA